MSKHKIDELEVYSLSIELGDTIWEIVNGWDFLAKETVGKQFIRAADSIAANISEGYGRYFYKENRQFCYYSRGSIIETKTWVLKSRNRNLISEHEFEMLNSQLEVIHRKLNGYIRFIGKTPV